MNNNIAKWQSEMQAYVASHQGDWSSRTAPAPPAPEAQPPPPEKITTDGTYTLENNPTSGSGCGPEQLTTIKVTSNSAGLAITATISPGPPSSVTLTGRPLPQNYSSRPAASTRGRTARR